MFSRLWAGSWGCQGRNVVESAAALDAPKVLPLPSPLGVRGAPESTKLRVTVVVHVIQENYIASAR
jgi:hypothetical protein